MGLRTASVRHPHAEVMAPALTETTQNQSFNLPPKGQLEPASPINSYEENKQKRKYKQPYFKSKTLSDIEQPYENSEIQYLPESLVYEKLNLNKCSKEVSVASDIFKENIDIMSISPTLMGDQNNEMGLQKANLDVASIHKEKPSSDMDQLFHTLSSVLPESENACSTSDLGPMEDIMQVIKSIENDRLNNSSTELNSENDEIFPMPGTDLTKNLSSFEKELLENVDVMNITIEDQQDDLDTVEDTVNKQKESQAKENLNELQLKLAKADRRLDFLRRRLYKLQTRMMGQHISGEITGVFENIQRLLKRHDSVQESMPFGTFTDGEKLKPISLASAKALIKKLEMTAILQANAVARQKSGSTYFGSGSADVPTFRNNLSGMVNISSWPTETKSELQKVAGQLKTQLGIVQKEVDSEATDSSSGGESCDEMHSYSNPHQQYLSV